ncbi:MAG: hypothetical protein AAF234_09185 [Pseudomonadota bacterium]
MPRRLLTKAFVDDLAAPKSGEVWIADTALRGFGLRCWRNKKSSGAAFGIRKVDKDGRPVRKTFDPWRDVWNVSWKLRTGQITYSSGGTFSLSSFLKDARRWAKHELDLLSGREATDEERAASEELRHQFQEQTGPYLNSCELGHLVELIVSRSAARGWTQVYTDRLVHAFNLFDPSDKIRKLTPLELSDGRLADLIEDSGLTPGNARLLRSLLNAVFQNVDDLGGVSMYSVMPRQPLRLQSTSREIETFFAELRPSDLDDLLACIRALDHGWRSQCCLELCIHFPMPVQRIMQGRWLRIVDVWWVPYTPEERDSWDWRTARINRSEFECLKTAHESALEEGIASDFWFPKKTDPSRPISNLDRAWHAVLKRMDWPPITLSYTAKKLHRRLPFRRGAWWGDQRKFERERDEMIKEMATWDRTTITDRERE